MSDEESRRRIPAAELVHGRKHSEGSEAVRRAGIADGAVAQPMLNRESHQAERFPERRRHEVATSYFSRAFFFALRAARAAVEAFFARATRSSGVMDADAFFARATRASGVIAAAAFFPPLLP